MTPAIKVKFAALAPLLDEQARRLWAAVEARAIGRGGIPGVAEATGLSQTTIRAGLRELDSQSTADTHKVTHERLRRPGGDRRALVAQDPGLLQPLEALVEPVTRGEPMGPLRGPGQSATRLGRALQTQGHAVSERSVNQLLHDLGYSWQSNRKTIAGSQHQDRAAPFQHINQRVQVVQRQRQPVVSVDTKKKALVGQCRHSGRERAPKGQSEPVEVYDFPDQESGKGIPYGVYDRATNTGRVRVGVDHDTAELAVETMRCWWYHMGSSVYPRAQRSGAAPACGRWSCKSWPMISDCGFRCVTFRRVPAHGTKSHTGCVAISQRTGWADPW
jgi:hypothetical protein